MFTSFKNVWAAPVLLVSASEHDCDAGGGFVPQPNLESCAPICFAVWNVLHPRACFLSSCYYWLGGSDFFSYFMAVMQQNNLGKNDLLFHVVLLAKDVAKYV